MPRPPGPVTTHTPGRTSSRRHTRPSMHWAYTPSQRRRTGGSGRPRIRPARASSSLGRVLAQREVEGLVVGVGVADGQPAVEALHQQELEVVLGGHRVLRAQTDRAEPTS